MYRILNEWKCSIAPEPIKLDIIAFARIFIVAILQYPNDDIGIKRTCRVSTVWNQVRMNDLTIGARFLRHHGLRELRAIKRLEAPRTRHSINH